VPLAQAAAIARTLPAALSEAFGRTEPVAPTHAAPLSRRPAPLVLRDLLRGVPSDPVAVERHVYGSADGVKLALDLYRPHTTPEPRPVVVTLHGGAWQGGSRGDFVALNRYLAACGYFVAAVDYRVAPSSPFPAGQQDVAVAVAYLKGLAPRIPIDPDRFALLGRSAGGQMALLAAYTLHDPAVRGVISYYGPAALRWGYDTPARKRVIDSSAVLEVYLGGPPATHGWRYGAAEPSRFVDASSPPTLFIQGLRDELVSPFHNEFVRARLIEEGVPAYILRMPWGVHGCDFFFRGPCGQLSTYAVDHFLEAVMK